MNTIVVHDIIAFMFDSCVSTERADISNNFKMTSELHFILKLETLLHTYACCTRVEYSNCWMCLFNQSIELYASGVACNN